MVCLFPCVKSFRSISFFFKSQCSSSSIVHSPLFSIKFYLGLWSPSSSNYTWSLLPPFLSLDFFSMYSLVAIFYFCSTCLAMRSFLRLNICPSQFQFSLHISTSTGSCPVFLHRFSLAILSCHCNRVMFEQPPDNWRRPSDDLIPPSVTTCPCPLVQGSAWS